ncbi:MAG: hypothetical protein HQK91_14810 [Nitrospirae bacterium]|nr:hypothetical protein [Nitrospirota bacterium]MBF0542709.1 hypothetical protein [Nitrospirota bacterium]
MTTWPNSTCKNCGKKSTWMVKCTNCGTLGCINCVGGLGKGMCHTCKKIAEKIKV